MNRTLIALIVLLFALPALAGEPAPADPPPKFKWDVGGGLTYTLDADDDVASIVAVATKNTNKKVKLTYFASYDLDDMKVSKTRYGHTKYCGETDGRWRAGVIITTGVGRN